MEPRDTYILDALTNAPVRAIVYRGVTSEQLHVVETHWSLSRAQTRESEHSHWDWREKAPLLNDPNTLCVGIECAGQFQGLMLVRQMGDLTRLEPAGLPLVYVDYLESAPWNQRQHCENPRYGQIGKTLLKEAIRLSQELGYNGSIGLHSLPQSERYYESVCGMTAVGPDPRYYGLMYYEFSEFDATWFLGEVT